MMVWGRGRFEWCHPAISQFTFERYFFENVAPDVFGPVGCDRCNEKGLRFNESKNKIAMHISTCNVAIPAPCILITEESRLKCRFKVCSLVMSNSLFNERIHFVLECS